MADPIIGNNIRVEVQSSLGPALTISAITKANPGVATFTEDTSGAPANGDIVVFTMTSGMDEIHGQAVRVAGRAGTGAASTFQLEGINTTLYETFVTGTLETVETLVAFDKIRTISAPNAEPPEIDVTTLKDKRSKIVYGLSGAIKGSFTALFNPGGTTEAILTAASENQTSLAWRETYADGRKTVMNALVSFGEGYSLAPNAAAESQGTFTPQGAKGMVHYAT